ncbi:MAG: DoxX family protein [Sediminibacterium sp.]|nr:DoxX family protein [Sediminibacterium sp.]MBX9780458.1 DoxX family protein [Chitinophagaceae bacterium]
MTKNKIFPWLLRIIAAVIMLQTLYFKFTAAEESVYIFSTLGIEPWGRIGTGIAELIASVLLLIPATTVVGALLAMGIMGGAIVSHLAVLGIEVRGDGGQLFAYALTVFIATGILAWLNREKIFGFIQARKA